MIELVADLPYRVVDAAGAEYYASVAGEQRPDGVWEAWLKYVPTDESDALVTPTETTQSSRADVLRWAGRPRRLLRRDVSPRLAVLHGVRSAGAERPRPSTIAAAYSQAPARRHHAAYGVAHQTR